MGRRGATLGRGGGGGGRGGGGGGARRSGVICGRATRVMGM